jgi:hypothetical protein
MANGLARDGPRRPWRRPRSRSGVRQERFLFFMAGFRAHFPAVTPPATERARSRPLLTACFARPGSARRQPRPVARTSGPIATAPAGTMACRAGTTAQPTGGTPGQVAARPGSPARQPGPAARSCLHSPRNRRAGLAHPGPSAGNTPPGRLAHHRDPAGTRHRARRKTHRRAGLGTVTGTQSEACHWGVAELR